VQDAGLVWSAVELSQDCYSVQDAGLVSSAVELSPVPDSYEH
jgi:hypothetical protein